MYNNLLNQQCSLQSSLPYSSQRIAYIYTRCIYSAAAPAVLGQQIETKNDEAAWISGERSSNNGKLQLQMNEQSYFEYGWYCGLTLALHHCCFIAKTFIQKYLANGCDGIAEGITTLKCLCS